MLYYHASFLNFLLKLLCESKNREHFDLILTFPIVQQPIRSDSKPQETQTNS